MRCINIAHGPKIEQMKALALTFFTLVYSFASGANEGLLSPQVLGENLSRLWAQEYIGSDLIREELKALANNEEKVIPVDLAVVDLGFEEEHITLTEEIPVPYQRNGSRRMRANHGTSVVNLLTGPSAYRVTDQANLMNLTAASFSGMYAYMAKKFEENKRYPKVISNSLGWSDEKIPEVVSEVSSKGVLWFLAAGNDFPKEVNKIERESQALLIGSFAPSGLTSYEAQNHKNLLVLAPANEELLTLNGHGQEHMFGASSGATPLVAGTVINLLSIVPQLTRAQVISLIKKTAFPSVENKLGFHDMPGLLNGYKAFKVALRLKELCEKDQTCYSKIINESELYEFDFPLELEEKYNCFLVAQSSDEEEKQKLLKELRRLSFLGSRFHQMETACAYRAIGLPKNAEYFDFISSKSLNLEYMEAQAKKAHNEAKYQISYYRYGPYYSEDYLKHLEESPMQESHKKMLKKLTKEDLYR